MGGWGYTLLKTTCKYESKLRSASKSMQLRVEGGGTIPLGGGRRGAYRVAGQDNIQTWSCKLPTRSNTSYAKPLIASYWLKPTVQSSNMAGSARQNVEARTATEPFYIYLYLVFTSIYWVILGSCASVLPTVWTKRKVGAAAETSWPWLHVLLRKTSIVSGCQLAQLEEESLWESLWVRFRGNPWEGQGKDWDADFSKGGTSQGH